MKRVTTMPLEVKIVMKTDKQKELYNKVQDRKGGRPPYSDENSHSKPDNMPHVTRRFIKRWDRHGAWQTKKKWTIRFVDQIDDTWMSTEDQVGPENNDIHHSIKKKTNLHDMMSTTSSQTYEIGHTPISMHSETCRNSLNSPQMAVNSTQPLTTNRQCLQTLSEMERHQCSTIHREHLNADIKTDIMVSKPWAVHTMPSQLQDTGSLPGSQPSTHLEMHRNVPNSPHTAICSILKKTNDGL